MLPIASMNLLIAFSLSTISITSVRSCDRRRIRWCRLLERPKLISSRKHSGAGKMHLVRLQHDRLEGLHPLQTW